MTYSLTCLHACELLLSPGDGYTFGVKDAVDEFAAHRGIRVYQTTERYLPSFYFLKC